MNVVGAALAFILILGLVLYFRQQKQQRTREDSADDYKRLFDGIPTPMYIYDDKTFRFLAVNDAAIEQYGYTREEFLNLRITDIRPPEEIPALLKFHESLPEGHVNAGRMLHWNKAGQRFYVSVYTHYTMFEGKGARQVLIVNIDEKMRAEQIVSEKSAELENMLDSITDGFYALNRNWEVTFMNKAAEQALSCTREEVMGKNLWDFFPNSREGRFYPEYERAMNERVSVHFEELDAPLGVWGSMNVYPTKDGIAVYFVDITEQKKIQEKIYNDGQNLRAIINNTRDLIWSVDRHSNIITGNQAFWDRVKELTGKNEDEVTNADFVQERMKVFFESYERAFKGEVFSVVRQREIDGKQVYEELSFNPIRDVHNEVIGVNCFLRDITEREEHLQKIENQNKRLREIAWIHSHLVRAPLASILGLVQLCDPNDSPNAEIIPMLKKSAEDLDKVIQDITVLTDKL
ncbi:PAS domain S-box protein [Mucilaginibacter rubeus]|uniref:histidine kinase n=1 Tax=Mucilaginibacter rubeus TaxID=2027860 RepID=A0AAE6JFV8_9SPHI|nr:MULTISPECIES: PAS domain S-box protein [Mucilaginibacter]QEM04989.1 PAS domain S-box protein [Mucilaginibacter rubeus]QEM17583.1 PAS domain S-box protein [Mucilaginibacter gossypii]QTE45896.1 PAS domain S-box protein [Mucilaginibacter rubeus]QTE52493.1 PAS domain S-box protein [Mucilaginibacter rubeus]QTE57582.1 PAS domain S-box protein [Mucilaginibacter rubeus]